MDTTESNFEDEAAILLAGRPERAVGEVVCHYCLRMTALGGDDTEQGHQSLADWSISTESSYKQQDSTKGLSSSPISALPQQQHYWAIQITDEHFYYLTRKR